MEMRVAIGGLGTIGLTVARKLDAGMEGLRLAAVSANDIAKARRNLDGFATTVPVLRLEELADHADVVVECAPAAVFDRVARPAVEAGRIFIPLSVGALLERDDLIRRARETGARIIVPSGAILGLDGIKAAAEGEIRSVTHVTRKPPRGLAGAPYLEEQGISLENLSEPRLVFAGTAREGARHFPANVNVSAAVSLAGIGPDRTRLELWADPSISRNMHRVTVEADAARFTVEIEGVPSPDSPRTGLLTPQSVVSTLRGLVSVLTVGT